ncbi:MAG: hypothetical protein BWY85_02434 [Firmicutes bacterium ADurb.Bin506]|nr:MAG: hypothetical protein BWY85_02434 [Firmicutes bacterium ADurb.Bin506]
MESNTGTPRSAANSKASLFQSCHLIPSGTFAPNSIVRTSITRRPWWDIIRHQGRLWVTQATFWRRFHDMIRPAPNPYP